MSAQRKLVDPALPTPLENAAPVETVAPSEYETGRFVDGDLPMSPAILLQEQLAARFANAGAGAVATQDASGATEAKWPMPLRIAAIVGLSLALWGGIFLATVAVLT